MHLKTTRNCRACARLFEVDHRNRHHQAYCPDARCQRQRRAQAQQQRRTTRRTASSAAVNGAGRRSQDDVKPSEADWIVASPMFIGLISMLTGSTDLGEIKAVSRRLHERGMNILGEHPGCDVRSLVKATS